MKLGKRILRQGVFALPLSLFTAFTVTLFAATQTLWENTAELWFSWEQMAGGVALAGGIAAAILTLVLAVLPKKGLRLRTGGAAGAEPCDALAGQRSERQLRRAERQGH